MAIVKGAKFSLVLLGLLFCTREAWEAEGSALPPAQAKKGKLPARDPLEFWFNPQRAQAAAAAELVLCQHPLTALAMRLQGKTMVVWGELEFPDERVPPLDPNLLRSARDRDGKPLPNLAGRPPDEITQAERDYIKLYSQALVNSFRTPLDVFIKSSRENEHVTFAHMYNEPWKYRGKVIPVKGHLRRLRKFDAPESAQANGIREIYEGWISVPTYGAHPLCVIFPILPERLKPSDQNLDRWVEFYGYFINRYRYRSGRGDLETALLIGPAVVLAPQPPSAQGKNSFSSTLVYGFVGFVFVVALAMVGLHFWFRKGDQRVRSHLDQLQAERTMETLENPLPEEEEKEKPW